MKTLTQDRIYRIACLDSIALISERIQQKGRKTDESQIGEYSDKTVSFKPITSQFHKIGTKKQVLSRYKTHGDIDEFYGYKDLRRALGRQVNYVDLTLTGQMIDSLVFDKTAYNEYSIGFANKAAADKAGWNEAKYGIVFELSNKEKELVLETIEAHIDASLGR